MNAASSAFYDHRNGDLKDMHCRKLFYMQAQELERIPTQDQNQSHQQVTNLPKSRGYMLAAFDGIRSLDREMLGALQLSDQADRPNIPKGVSMTTWQRTIFLHNQDVCQHGATDWFSCPLRRREAVKWHVSPQYATTLTAHVNVQYVKTN